MKTRIEQKREKGWRHAVGSKSAGLTSGDGEVRERIAVRAYELYQERGCCDGHDVDDWLEARASDSRTQRQCLISPAEMSCESPERGTHESSISVDTVEVPVMVCSSGCPSAGALSITPA